MKANGRTIRRRMMPDRSTITLKARPRSLVNVMSPKPSVLMTVSVQ
jgi:hypothetical protein